MQVVDTTKPAKWGAPAFYNATGGGIGLSIGGGSFDITTLVTSDLGAGELVSGKGILGSSKATAVAGSTGNVNITASKNASFITNAKPENGLFAGADLGGIEIDFKL